MSMRWGVGVRSLWPATQERATNFVIRLLSANQQHSTRQTRERKQCNETSRLHQCLPGSNYLCSIRILKTTDALPSAFCGIFTETKGDAPVLIVSVPSRFGFDWLRKSLSCFCSSDVSSCNAGLPRKSG